MLTYEIELYIKNILNHNHYIFLPEAGNIVRTRSAKRTSVNNISSNVELMEAGMGSQFLFLGKPNQTLPTLVIFTLKF